MADTYIYQTDARICPGCPADCFAARMDTIGPRAVLYYFATPYVQPIDANGKLSEQLSRILRKIRLHKLKLFFFLNSKDQFLPRKLFKNEARDWAAFPRFYTVVDFYVFAGRRKHFTRSISAARQNLTASVNKELACSRIFHEARFHMKSYDSILEQAQKAP
jgi:hypothetical protein